MIVATVGWVLFFGAVGLAFLGAWVQRRGRHEPWLRVARAQGRRTLAPCDAAADWRQVVAAALTAGIRVGAVEWEIAARRGADVRVDSSCEAPDGWRAWCVPAGPVLRVTLPGDDWADALNRVGGAAGLARQDILATWLDRARGGLPSINELAIDRARLVVRAPQVLLEVPLAGEWSGKHSPSWVERVRDTDFTALMVVLALVGSVGLVITGSLVATAVGVIGLVALSGACKFVFMSRRSDPTREQFLQNY